MSSSVAVSSIITLIRDFDFDDDYFPDAELIRRIDISHAAFHDLLIEIDDAHFLSTQSISVVSGTGSYSLASDFFRLKGVSYLDDNNEYRVMDRGSWDNRNDTYLLESPNPYKWETVYEIRGGKLYLYPTPTWNGTVKVEYLKTAAALDESSDSFDSINLWHRWIVNDVCIELCDKDLRDPAGYVRRKMEAERRIRALGKIDRNQPAQRQNVHRYTRRGYWGF